MEGLDRGGGMTPLRLDILPTCSVTVLSRRSYDEPKLRKPSELVGIRPAFSVDFIPKRCRCQCFILGDHVYTKHRDFDSVEVYGGTREGRLLRKSKFIFNDNFGCVVLRGEAWLRLEGVVRDVGRKIPPYKIATSLVQSLFGEPSFGDWYRFFERVAEECGREVRDGE